ncbi:MAG: arginine--tRNA ligase, partial [Flavonifractor plautii]
QTIVDHLDLEGSYFQKVEIAGPGFLNFTLGPKWYQAVLADVEREGTGYGSNSEGGGEKVMVEFVSANPTGPMHMGNARGGVLGDTLANVLKRDGCDTWKEFYVNDAGNQIHKFAVSINARYMQLILGEEKVPFPRTAITAMISGTGPGLLRPPRRPVPDERGAAPEARGLAWSGTSQM